MAMMSEVEQKSRLLALKQELFNSFWTGLKLRPATKVERELAARRRKALKIEATLAAIEEQQIKAK